ncbi:mycothiol synthase [Solwaraspora sp. WMMD1047]|uniref:mycothiol synthase n=1 Tax=Solwaraspora sp. WMMD1047 TaxID=3016102 RepID=UPI002417AF94|nr:mycothiol synthase [Solwaraspora sp. WMMD1047]MDG4833675.1 mycothiol synthase [Solwaraspora sp. WMMD1047]
MTTAASAPRPPVDQAERLTSTEIRDVLALTTAADTADGTVPFSEHVRLRIRHGGDQPVIHLLVRDGTAGVLGYAHLEPAAAGQPATGELVVHPARRRRGLGRALLTAATAASGGALRMWAHGDHPSAAALALDLGFTRNRVLWQMRRDLGPALPEPRLPAGVRLRAFRPGQDEQAWLAVNGRAFASHPEQGRWTAADLADRLAEPWFDPAGFLLAVEEGTDRLVGFHWTKVHPPAPGGRTPVGEVYVVGVDADARGGGLGSALTVAGLRHLREQGLRTVTLYVDESNTAATALYRRLGFAPWTVDVNYERS